jgi:hypothetical protein
MDRRVIVNYPLCLPVLDSRLPLLPLHRHSKMSIETDKTSENTEILKEKQEKNKNT